MKILRSILMLVFLCGTAFAQNDGRATYHVFPQFADGKFSDGTYYRSAIVVSNPSTTVSGTCQVTPRGLTWTLQVARSNFNISGTLNGTFGPQFYDVLSTLGTANFQSGYATVSCAMPTTAQVIYGFYNSNGAKISEATVFSSPPSTGLQLIVDQRGGARLGIAIANDTDSVATVTLTANRAPNSTSETVVGTTSISIPARSNYVKFLDEAITNIPADFLGRALVSSNVAVSLIGLRFTGAAFTTIPSTVR